MTANFDDLQLEPELTAEEFAFELEPVQDAGPLYDALPDGGKCEEFGLQLGDKIIPCGDIAVGVVHHAKDRRDYLMCLPHLMHNVNNRGGVMKVAPRAIEPAPATPQEPPAAALMQVLPADFPLPTLIRFVPDPALRLAADQAAKYALSLEIAGEEGVTRGDAACTALRASLKGIEAHFEQPAEIANRLHKQITGTRSEWCATGKAALDTVGRRVATEQRRLQAEEAERRRRAQEEEDRKERERRRQEAEAAQKAQAPAPVVEELKRQAETATAPPVPVSAPAPKLSGSSVTGTWKARLKGTSGEADPLPSTDNLSPAQREQVLTLLRAIVAGAAPVQAIELNASYLCKRAKADRSTLDIPGIEAFEDIGLRAKGGRSGR